MSEIWEPPETDEIVVPAKSSVKKSAWEPPDNKDEIVADDVNFQSKNGSTGSTDASNGSSVGESVSTVKVQSPENKPSSLNEFIQKQQDSTGQLYPETPVKIATPKPQASQEQAEDNLKNIFSSHKMWDDPAAREKLYNNLSKKGYDLNTLKESGERFVNAKNNIEGLGKKAQESPQAAYEYATALGDLGKHTDAFSIYTNLIKEGNHSPEVYKGLAYSLHKLGDDKEAQRAYQAAQDIESKTKPISEIPSIDVTNPQSEHMKSIAGALERVTPIVSQAKNLVEGTDKTIQGVREAKQILSETNRTATSQADVAAGIGKSLLHGGAAVAGGAISYLMNTTPVGLAFVEATQGITSEGTKKVAEPIANEIIRPVINKFSEKGITEFTPDEALGLLGMPISTILEKKGVKNPQLKDTAFLGDMLLVGLVGHKLSNIKGMSAGQIDKAYETADKIHKGENVPVEDVKNLSTLINSPEFASTVTGNPKDLQHASETFTKAEKVNSLASDIENTKNTETKAALTKEHETSQQDLLNTLKQQADDHAKETADQTHNEILTEHQDKLKEDLPNVENKDVVENTIQDLEKDKVPVTEQPIETPTEEPINPAEEPTGQPMSETEVVPEEPTPDGAVRPEGLPSEPIVEPIKKNKNARSIKTAVEVSGSETPGTTSQVAGGESGGLQQPANLQKPERTTRSKSSDEPTHEEVKTPLEVAKENRKKAKKDLDKYNDTLKIIDDPEERARRLVAYHKALVTELKEWIKEKAGTLADYIRETGEEFTMGLKRAWDEANGSRPIEDAKELGYEHPDEPVFGIKNESTKALNASLGFPDVDLTAEQRRDIKTVMEGAAKLEGNAETIIEKTHKNKTPMNAEDEVVVLNHVIKLSNDLMAEEQRFEDAVKSGDEGTIESSLLNASSLTEQIKRANDALQISGYEQGLAFRVRQIMRKRDYTLAESIRKYQMANNGEAVPHAVRQKLFDLSKKIEDLTQQNEKIQKQHEDAVSQWAFEKIKLENERDNAQKTKPTRKRGNDLIAEGLDDLATIFGAKKNIIEDGKPEIRKAVTKIAQGILDNGLEKGKDLFEQVKKYIKDKFDQELPDSYKEDALKAEEKTVPKAKLTEDGKLEIPRELIKSVVEKGVDDIEDLTAKIHDILKEQFPDKDFTHREVRDAITDYGKTIHLSQEEIDVKIRQLRQEGRDVSGLEDAIKGEGVKRTGLQRDPVSQKHREMLKKIKEEMKKHPQDEADIDKKWKSSLDAIKTNLNNQIADLTKRLDDLTNNRPVDEKNIPKKVEYDEEAKSLREHRDNLKQAVEEIEGKAKISDEQKVNNAISAAERSADEYERRIKNKDFAPRVIPKLPEVEGLTQRLNEVRKARDEKKAEYEKLLKEQNPKKTALEKLIQEQQDFTDNIEKEKEKEKADQAKIDQLKKKKDLTEGEISNLKKEIESQKTPEEKKIDRLQKELDNILAGKTREGKDKPQYLTSWDHKTNTYSVETEDGKVIRSGISSRQEAEKLAFKGKGEVDSNEAARLKDQIAKAKEEAGLVASKMSKDPRMIATERALNNYEKQIEQLAKDINNRNIEYKKKTDNTYETAATKAAKARLDEGRRILKQMRDEAGIAEQRRIDLWKKRQQKAIDALEEEKKQGFPEKAPKPEPKPLNQDQTRILAQRQALMNERDLAIKQRELDNRTWIEKKIAKAVAFSRNIKLSSILTVGKLLAFDVHNIAWYKPLKELLPNIIKGGERHSGRFNPKAIASAYKVFIDKATLEDMNQARQTGKSQFQLAYGIEKPLPPELASYFGHLHAALKVPSIRAEFLFSAEKRMQAEVEKNGSWASTDPETISRVNAAALNDATSNILLGENITNDSYAAILRGLKNTQNNSKGVAALKKSIAYTMEFQFPIVKVPTNYVKEVGAHTPLGFAKAAFDVAVSKGIKNMSPKEIDNVNNLFKSGLIGSAFLALGYYNRNEIGGYDDRFRGKIGRGSIRVFGYEIPHWFLHFPPFELLQIGATIGHYSDKKSETGKGGLVEGMKQSAGGVIQQTPFIGEPVQYMRAAGKEGGWTNLAASDVAGALIPPDLAKIAYATDTQDTTGKEQSGFHPMSETVYRPAKNPLDQFGLKIPGIRKMYPSIEDSKLQNIQKKRAEEKYKVPKSDEQLDAQDSLSDAHEQRMKEMFGKDYIPTKEEQDSERSNWISKNKREYKAIQKQAESVVTTSGKSQSQIDNEIEVEENKLIDAQMSK